MSPRVKAQLYHSLAQLIRAGITFPRALEKLSKTARGSARGTIAQIHRGLERGKTIGEACAAAGVGGMEAAVLAAVERAGYLDRGLEELARHFEAVASARGKVIAKLAYPAFILVLGVLLLNLPLLVKQDANAYLRATVPLIGGAVAVGFVFLTVCKFLAAMAAYDSFLDGLLRLIPLIGGTRRAFAMSRFCMAYELQLGAGINVLDALQAAAVSSRSGLVRSVVARALPKVRGGEPPGALLGRGSAFDMEVVEGIVIAEDTGSLGTGLRRLAETQSEKAYHRLNALSEWIPRLIYLAVMLYVGWQIVRVYRDYFEQLKPLLEGV
jgi:type II secretory pathway component PulF